MLLNLDTFSTLFRDYKHRFVHFAQTYVRDTALAEDIVADSITKFLEKRSSLAEDTNVPAYILTMIRNRCIDYLRHQQTYTMISEGEGLTAWDLDMRLRTLLEFEPDQIYTKEIRYIVRRTLEDLPEKTRRIFQLSRNEGRSNREIAERMGISEKGVEYHMSKAIRTLRDSLKDYLPLWIIILLIN